MKPIRTVALVSLALFLIILGTAWLRTRPDYSDGATALTSVPRLKKGMTIGEVTAFLHPVRSRRASVISYALHSDPKNGSEIVHPLTPDRYLVLRCSNPRPGSRSGDPTLTSWRLVEGTAPRDDVTIGRAFTPGPFKFYY